jgi:hypothetical protein
MMNWLTTQSGNRREFVRDAARWALLAVVAAVSALLAATRRVTLPDQTCVNKGICSGCAVFAKCELPAALSAKVAANRRGT